jgi:hypothetical protein
VTYARRYGLQSLLSIGADDDDGNSASPTIKDAISEMKQQSKIEDVATIWSKYKQFQTEKTFIAVKDEMKSKLIPTT